MYGNKRIHAALAFAGLCAGMTATMSCVMEDPALFEEADRSALFEQGVMDDQAVLAAQESPASSTAETTLVEPDDARIELSDPVYAFARHSGKALDVAGWSQDNGAELIQWDHHGGVNQLFLIEPVDGVYFRIVAVHSGKVLDVAGGSYSDGARIIQWDWHGGDNQLFHFEHLGAGEYKITAKHSGKVLDVSGASTANGANVIQWTWHGGNNQRWLLSPAL